MNLLAIRTKVAKKSGRYDLVVDAPAGDWSDNGMDFHITAGQRWLDKRSRLPRTFVHLQSTLASGAYYKELSSKFKELDSVSIDGGVNTLTYKTLAELEALYDASAPGSAPAYYAYASYRTLQTAETLAFISAFVDLEWPEDDDDRYDFPGIIIVPEADQQYTLTVGGDFLPLEMSDDADTNFWSEEYPHILVMAALRSLATIDDEDMEMAAYWEKVISSEAQGLI